MRVKDKEKQDWLTPVEIGSFLAVLSFLCPVLLMIHPVVMNQFHLTIINIGFILDYVGGYIRIFLEPMSFLIEAMLGGFRFIFAYQMMKLYNGATTKGRALLCGFLSELPPLLFAIPQDIASLLAWLSSGWITSILIPLPLPLVIGIAFLKLTPPTQQSRVDSSAMNWWLHQYPDGEINYPYDAT